MSSNSKDLSTSSSANFPPTPPSTPAVGGPEDTVPSPKLMDEEDVVMVDKKDAEDSPGAPVEGDGAAADAASAEAPDAATAKPEVLIRNLCILPPRQSKKPPQGGAKKARKDLDALGVIPLPPLRPEEPVQSLRNALSEVKGYAHLTSYRLVVEDRPEGIEAALTARREGMSDGSPSSSTSAPSGSGDAAGSRNVSDSATTASKKSKKKKSKAGGSESGSGSNIPNRGGSSPFNRNVAPTDVVSPHTGPDAVVATPSSARSLEVSTYTHYLGTTIPVEAAAEVAAVASSTSSSGTATSPGSNGAKKKGSGNGEAQFDEVVLDDFTDLSPYLERGLTSDKAALRIVLERYNVAGVRDHVVRLRQIFDGLVPSVTTLADGVEEEQQPAGGADAETEKAASSTAAADEGDDEKKVEEETSDADNGGNNVGAAAEKKIGDSKEASKEEKAKQILALQSKMPNYPLDGSVALDGTNTADFFYLSCGEEDDLDAIRGRQRKVSVAKANAIRAGISANKTEVAIVEEAEAKSAAEAEAGRKATTRMIELEARCRVHCKIKFGGFHPPPANRRIFGDLAYLEVTLPGASKDVVHITAVPSGFYVNKTSIAPEGYGEPFVFDPRPAENACYSHELLDCLLQYSKTLRSAWADALDAARERAELTFSMATNDSPVQSLYRVATRNDFSIKPSPNTLQQIDALMIRPSWLAPKGASDHSSPSTHGIAGGRHEYNQARADEDMASTFGVDIRGGAVRDFNEELQSARELPRSTLQERMDRAKMVHKVLVDFGEAAMVGAKAIIDGLVVPMNPNEPARSHVYFHNNIFFSRAVDAGVDTFKISQGDRAARKAASRDANCMGMLHRADIKGLHNLATVLVDYLGTRLVCQSVVPGILQGEKTHTLLYGSVEATQPLSWDEDLHKLLEESLGRGFMIATRPVPTLPLSDERMALIEKLRAASLENLSAMGVPLAGLYQQNNNKETKPLTELCAPLEAKGIRGSDQRNYLLDLSRLTPRDANWVPESEGGTGRWEAVASSAEGGRAKKFIPDSLDDDEHTMAILRNELVSSLTRKQMSKYLLAKKEKKNTDNKEEATTDSEKDSIKEEEKEEEEVDAEDEDFLASLRLNPNVFLPNIKSLEGIDNEAYKQIKEDEERVREAAAYLWDDVLPGLTKDIRENSGQILPVDGETLCEVLHQRGINCRYLGRLATMAIEEEEKDRKVEADFTAGKVKSVPRRQMPLSWLELLECEMVARAAKHVLNSYLAENGGYGAAQPAQIIACFFSAVLSIGEERAGETEIRLKKSGGGVDDTDVPPSFLRGQADPSFNRSRAEIWEDIESEIGRRFRYVLTLYNTPQASAKTKNGGSMETKPRTLYTPLLRRLCQRNGVRLVAKTYEIGGKCLCSGGNISYPIATSDVAGILPLVKHAAAAPGSEGFFPASFDSHSGPPSLHILLPDAKSTFDTAYAAWNQKALPQALDLFQESSNLYQHVVDTPLHMSIAKCLRMSAVILFQAGKTDVAAANAARSLAITVQLGGFDHPEAANSHSTLAHILLNSNETGEGIKHLRAATYLTELMAGRNHPDLGGNYHKLGTIYHELGSPVNGLRFYQEASLKENADRIVSGMIAKSTALALANVGHFKSALESEKRAYNLYRCTLGEDHELTKSSAQTMTHFTKIAVQQGTRIAKEEKKKKDEQAANAMASEMVADELAAEAAKASKKKKNRSKKSKGKK